MTVGTKSQTSSELAHPKPKGRFTGERLKVLRPEVYWRVVDLLAEPRAQVPYDHICRLLHVSEHSVKAIEKSQSISIAERKVRLMAKAFQIANKASDRVEETIHEAGCSQAAVVFGIFTEKGLLLAGEPTQNLQVTINAQDIYSELRTIHADITNSFRLSTCTDAEFTRLPDAPALASGPDPAPGMDPTPVGSGMDLTSPKPPR
jgi:hypothetical protein